MDDGSSPYSLRRIIGMGVDDMTTLRIRPIFQKKSACAEINDGIEVEWDKE